MCLHGLKENVKQYQMTAVGGFTDKRFPCNPDQPLKHYVIHINLGKARTLTTIHRETKIHKWNRNEMKTSTQNHNTVNIT